MKNKLRKITIQTLPNGYSLSVDGLHPGGFLYFNGTDVDMTVSGKTYVSDATACAGIRSDRDFTQTAGDITITMESSDATALVVKGTENRTGGTLTVK
jgi:hypothetical protein